MVASTTLLTRAVSAPAYTIAEASRLAGITPGRTRRWLRGYEFFYLLGEDQAIRRGHMPPVIRRELAARRAYPSWGASPLAPAMARD